MEQHYLPPLKEAGLYHFLPSCDQKEQMEFLPWKNRSLRHQIQEFHKTVGLEGT